MKKILFAFAFGFIFFQGCQSPGQKKAFDYNNTIANISKVNHDKWEEIVKEINVSKESHDFSKLTTMITDLNDFLRNKIKEINTMSHPPGSEELTQAAVDFFQFEKSIAETLNPFAQMTAQTTSDEFQTAVQGSQNAAKDEEVYLIRLQDAQRAFAKKNGFEIEKTKTQ